MAARTLRREAGDIAAALGLRLAIGGLALLPARAAFALARGAGSLLHLALRRRRRIALRNLELALGDSVGERERGRIARRAFQHSASQLVSLVHRGRRVRDARDPGIFEIDPGADAWLEEARARACAQERGEGVAFLGGHLGDWEMPLHYLALRGFRMTAVARPSANPRVDAILWRLREASGGRVVARAGALREVRRALLEGRGVGLVVDQNAPQRRAFFPFFGIPASTQTRHARLLVAHAGRIVLILCLRTGPGFRFRVVVRDLGSGLIDGRAAGGRRGSRAWREEAARELVRRYLEALEAAVREAPAQYFWLHRRWKSRPTGAPWLYGELERSLPPGVLAAARNEPARG